MLGVSGINVWKQRRREIPSCWQHSTCWAPTWEGWSKVADQASDGRDVKKNLWNFQEFDLQHLKGLLFEKNAPDVQIKWKFHQFFYSLPKQKWIYCDNYNYWFEDPAIIELVVDNGEDDILIIMNLVWYIDTYTYITCSVVLYSQIDY